MTLFPTILPENNTFLHSQTTLVFTMKNWMRENTLPPHRQEHRYLNSSLFLHCNLITSFVDCQGASSLAVFFVLSSEFWLVAFGSWKRYNCVFEIFQLPSYRSTASVARSVKPGCYKSRVLYRCSSVYTSFLSSYVLWPHMYKKDFKPQIQYNTILQEQAVPLRISYLVSSIFSNSLPLPQPLPPHVR